MSNKSKPTARIVCWKCGRGGQKGDSPLKKISETNYVCLNDLSWGAPDKENQSEIRLKHDKSA